MSTFNIPWKCLDLTIEPKITTNEPQKPQKTFAQALAPTNLCDIPLSQFQQPVVKGDRLAIEIPEAAYEAGLEACKHNLHGRILWPKGYTPLSVVALKAKLALIWKDLSRWGVISLGKGYFEFTFSSLEDVRRVRSIPSWNLNPGILNFFAWSKDFNPRLQHNTSVQVWVRINGLSQEYWHKNILFTIAGSLGTPICIDSVTAKPMHEHTFGQFARVLIDIDLLQPLRYKLLVERKGFAFFVDLEYEHIPDFCSDCKIIGHNVDNCYRWKKDEEVRGNKDNIIRQKVSTKKAYVPISDGRVQHNKPNEHEQNNVEKEIINVEKSGNKSPQHLIEAFNPADPVQEGTTFKQQNMLETRPILAPVSPKSLLLAQDKQLENELNDDDVEAACVEGNHNKELVLVNTPTPVVPQAGGESSNPDALPTPSRVANDMAFLKESWANMVEAEDNTNQMMENTSHDEGFQIHLSKNKKKAQKKLMQSSRDSYAIRSRVPPKPFR
ncbi:hypothetical protein P8452_03226 [Trifolium repens]|nr:hypothetical protein P8452_03226 [Trifolium repens]